MTRAVGKVTDLISKEIPEDESTYRLYGITFVVDTRDSSHEIEWPVEEISWSEESYTLLKTSELNELEDAISDRSKRLAERVSELIKERDAAIMDAECARVKVNTLEMIVEEHEALIEQSKKEEALKKFEGFEEAGSW